MANKQADKQENEMVTFLSRDIVARIAPQELPLFKVTSEAYLKDPARMKAADKDEMLGFGAGETAAFLTPFVLAAAQEVLKFLVEEAKKTLKTESSNAVTNFIKAQFKTFQKQEKTDTKKSTEKLSPEAVSALTSAQIARIREIAYQQAVSMRLSEQRAKLLADAMTGSLVVSIMGQNA